MITHNMQQAISFGHRLVMMHQGKIILDFNQEDKEKLTVADLLRHFHNVASDLGRQISDRLVLV